MHLCNRNPGYGRNTRNITWMAIDIRMPAQILTLQIYIPVAVLSYIIQISNYEQN